MNQTDTLDLDTAIAKDWPAVPLKAAPRSAFKFDDRYDAIVDEIRCEYLNDTQCYPWIIGFSGGKDSTLLLQCVMVAVLDVAPSQRKREIHVVSNDTLVDSPLVIAHLDVVTARVRQAAESLRLPLQVIRTQPDVARSFWSLLIGKGYPSPNQQMRWCTDRLKIQPTSAYILDKVSASGSAIVLLGVRKDESQTRKQSIEKHQMAESIYSPHRGGLQNAYTYSPIVDLSTDDVWEFLAERSPPWGGDHSALIKLYRDADGGECPVVMSAEDAPGCGTSSSRFGCWTCTVVEKDKSLQGVIDGGNLRFAPLVEFRNWLKEIRDDPSMRQVERRNGRVTFALNGRHIPGPFTISARQKILERLREVQALFGEPLISDEEIDVIHKYWSEDFLAKNTGE